MNRVILMGNLGQEPELVFANSGTAILELRMATSERRKNKDTEQWEEFSEWHTVKLFGKRAEGLAKHLTKGSKICVEGKLRTRTWTDKNDNARYSTEILADEVEFADSRGGGQRQQREDRSDGNFGAPNGDDIPF